MTEEQKKLDAIILFLEENIFVNDLNELFEDFAVELNDTEKMFSLYEKKSGNELIEAHDLNDVWLEFQSEYAVFDTYPIPSIDDFIIEECPNE
ncbi:MAG: hypothetical protein AB7U85_04815 [Alphaproteobacteria bacterium]